MDDPPVAPAATDFRLSDEVVATVAGLAAAEVPGVTALGTRPGWDLGEVIGKRGAARAVRVEVGTREVLLDIYLHVAYGERIPLVAQRVQEAAKGAVESMTGLTVIQVNVHVQGVDVGGHGRGSAKAEGAGG